MKRWLVLAIVAMIVVSAIIALRSRAASEAMRKREAGYQLALQAYSRVLRPGMSRRQVEDYLHGKGTVFEQVWCVEDRTAFADLVRIGEEDHPWYCSVNYVYVAFQFAATEGHPPLKAYDSDVLKDVGILSQLGGCL